MPCSPWMLLGLPLARSDAVAIMKRGRLQVFLEHQNRGRWHSEFLWKQAKTRVRINWMNHCRFCDSNCVLLDVWKTSSKFWALWWMVARCCIVVIVVWSINTKKFGLRKYWTTTEQENVYTIHSDSKKCPNPLSTRRKVFKDKTNRQRKTAPLVGRSKSWSALNMANLTWSFAKLGLRHEKLYRSVAFWSASSGSDGPVGWEVWSSPNKDLFCGSSTSLRQKTYTEYNRVYMTIHNIYKYIYIDE